VKHWKRYAVKLTKIKTASSEIRRNRIFSSSIFSRIIFTQEKKKFWKKPEK